MTLGGILDRRYLERIRPELEHWVSECGLQEPFCRDAALVPRADTGEMVPWSLPTHARTLRALVYVVNGAAFYLAASLTGMRASELYEIRAGSLRTETRLGGGTRHRVASRRIKGAPLGGEEDAWVILPEVHHALSTAELVAEAVPGDLMFVAETGTAYTRYQALKRWINGPEGKRLGLEPIPDGPVTPRALRRTLALSIAQRPHGLMAARIQLKHVSVATTEGYAARPGGHQAKFLAEVAAEEEAEHTRITVAAYEDYKRGILPAGRGARDLVQSFRMVDAALDSHDAGTATVVDDRRIERLLKAKAKTLHVGPANYCWFTDPSKALCLKIAGTPTADRPLMGMCDSARCPQATHHAQHRQVWADHAANTKTVFLGNPRLSRPERQRAQDAYDRAMRIVTEIDNAHQEEAAGA